MSATLQSPLETTKTSIRTAWRTCPPSRFLHYKDFLSALKSEIEGQCKGRYTYQQFGSDLGLPAASGAYVVMHGYRRLNDEQAAAIIASLGLTGLERRYFTALRAFADADHESERNAAFKTMLELKERMLQGEEDGLRLRFFSEWQHAAIFELIDLPDFQSDPEWIATRFYKRLAPEQVKRSLALLERLGLIAYDEALGKHVKRAKSVTTGEKARGLAVVGYHLQMLELSQASLSNVPSDEREIGAMTLALDAPLAQRLREDLRMFKRYALFLSEQCESPDRIVQFNVQLFSMTRSES